jgi:two-component system response regulator RegA
MIEKRMLVVDDDPTTRFALHTLFSRQGWDVRLAGTVAEGLAQLQSGPEPRCLILDLNLPDGHGEAILRTVRTGGLRTRVAVCSGVDDPRRIADVLALEPEALLAKPIDLGPVMHVLGGG